MAGAAGWRDASQNLSDVVMADDVIVQLNFESLKGVCIFSASGALFHQIVTAS